MVKVKVKYLGPGSNEFSWGGRLKAVGGRRVVYSRYDNSCGVIPNPVPDAELFTGGEVEGNACWQIESSEAADLVMFVEPENRRSDAPRVWFSLDGGSHLPKRIQVTPEVSAAPVEALPPTATGPTETEPPVAPTPRSSERDKIHYLVIVAVGSHDVRSIDGYERTVLADSLGISEDDLPEIESDVNLVASSETNYGTVELHTSGFHNLELVPVSRPFGGFRSMKLDGDLRLFGRIVPDGEFQELTETIAYVDTVLDAGGVDSTPKISIGVSVPQGRTVHVEMLAYSSTDAASTRVSLTPNAESSPVTLLEVFGDGYWEIGTDIASGLYVSPGSRECQWQRLGKSIRGTASIIAEGGGNNPRVIVAPIEGAFITQGCGEWQPVVNLAELTDVFEDGIWIVGDEVRAGTYHAPGGERCFWARLSGFSDRFEDVIEVVWPGSPAKVEIAPDDVGFQTYHCGEWTRSE